MKTFQLIVHKFFRIFLVFLLAFIWVRYYEKNLLLAVLYSSVIAIAVDLVLERLTEKKYSKIMLKKTELHDAERFANHFAFCSKKTTLNFFEKLFSAHFDVTAKSNFLVWQTNTEITAFVPLFELGTLKIRDIITAFNITNKNFNPTKIIIAASEFLPETLQFAKSSPCKILLLNKFEIYEKLMKSNNIFPQNVASFSAPKKRYLSSLAEYAFSRKRTKAWVWASLLLLISSFFVRVSVYYLIISSLLLVLALISLCNSKFNKKNTENIF